MILTITIEREYGAGGAANHGRAGSSDPSSC